MRVAFDKISITPPNLANGIPMAGFYRESLAHEVHDDVFARGLLIEDEYLGDVKKKLLLISMDLLKAPMLILNYIKEQIQKNVDIAFGKGQILIACTHTHHAPDLTGEYYWPGQIGAVIKGILFGHNRYDRYIVWMARQVVKLAKQLASKLAPAKMAWAKRPVTEPITLNRRHPTDRTPQDLGVIAFKSLDGQKLLGLLVNYGTHPISICFLNRKISADYPGQVCARVEDATSGETGVVFFTGASGDLNPITTCGTDFEQMAKEKVSLVANKPDPKHQTHFLQFGWYRHSRKIGYHVADEALSLARSIPDAQYVASITVKAYTRLFWVPVKDDQKEKAIGVQNWWNWLTNKIVVFLKKYIITPVAMAAAKEPNFPGLTIKKLPIAYKKGLFSYNAYTQLHYIEIAAEGYGQCTKLGILGLPGELFTDIKKRLFQRSPVGAENTFEFQIANDWLGYLFPVREYITKADYEPFASTTPVAGEHVRKETLAMWDEIKAGLVPFS